MFTKKFWQATTERVVRGAAVAVLAVLGIGVAGGSQVNASLRDIGIAAFYGALGSLALSLAGGAFGTGGGPSFTGNEQLTADTPDDGE